jgi:hypothetical protein
MDVFSKGLLVLSLLLAMASSAAAQPVAEKAPPMQPVAEIVPAAQAEMIAPGPAAVAGSGQVESAAAVPPAAEVVKVSMLEPVGSTKPLTAEERQLESRKADFLKFAEVKLQEMNRNHILSRERMRIEKRSDGGYRASYHQLDDTSMSCQVSRSPTKAAQYVAVLSYKERVYSAACGTPAECRQGNFTPVEVIPNRHIFVYTNGVWQ